jgi:glutamate-1-semialdehyde aminotransferase
MVVLIFDEVKTGVVTPYGGAYEHFGIQPDLFCLAKSIGAACLVEPSADAARS